MTRNLRSLSVFVASPGDVADERVRLEEVIRELNVTWSNQLGIQLDLIRWETHAFPGFGDDPQDVINEQIPNDYDLFIGIMWCRYGTETKRAGSGTAEEFERAKARFHDNSASVRLMIYFKDAPIAPSRMDPAQLAKVAAFKHTVGDEGGLYWTFSSIEQFEKLIRLHLSRQVQSWVEDTRGDPAKAISQPIRKIDRDDLIPFDSDDESVLDLMEIFEDRVGAMNEISRRIASATEMLGSKLTARAAEISDVKAKTEGDVSKNVAKRLISNAASDMDQYVARMKTEVPLFGAAVSEGVSAFVKAMNMSLDDEMENFTQEEIANAMTAVSLLKATIQSTEDSMVGFRNVFVQLPRLTSVLNKAKRNVATVLDTLVIEFQTAQNLTNEAEAVIKRAASEHAKKDGR
jgi:Domain of unknown function (DUF4062)